MAQQPVVKSNNTPAARKAAAKERRQAGKEALRAAHEKDAMKVAANAAKHQEEWESKQKIAQAAKDNKAGDTNLNSANMKPYTRGDMTFAMQGNEQDIYAGIAEQLAKKRTPSPACADEVKDPHIPTIPTDTCTPMDPSNSSDDAALSPPSNDFDLQALQARRAIEEHSKDLSNALINEKAKSMALVKPPVIPDTTSLKSEKFDWADEVEASMSDSGSKSDVDDGTNPEEAAKAFVDSLSKSERQSSPEGTSETISPDTSIVSDEATGQDTPADQKIGRCIAGTSKLYLTHGSPKSVSDGRTGLDLIAAANRHEHCCAGSHPINDVGPLGRPNGDLIVAPTSTLSTHNDTTSTPAPKKVISASTLETSDNIDTSKQVAAALINGTKFVDIDDDKVSEGDEGAVTSPVASTEADTVAAPQAIATQHPMEGPSEPENPALEFDEECAKSAKDAVILEKPKTLSNKEKMRAKKLRSKARKAAEEDVREASSSAEGSSKSGSPSTQSKASSVNSDESPVGSVQEANKTTVVKNAGVPQLAVIPRFPPGWPYNVKVWNTASKCFRIENRGLAKKANNANAEDSTTLQSGEQTHEAADTVKADSAPSSPSSTKSWAQILASPRSISDSEGEPAKPIEGPGRSKTSSKSGNSPDREGLSGKAKLPNAKKTPSPIEPVLKVKEGSQKGKKQLKKLMRKDTTQARGGLYNEVLEEDTNVIMVKGMKMDDVKGELPAIKDPKIAKNVGTTEDAVIDSTAPSMSPVEPPTLPATPNTGFADGKDVNPEPAKIEESTSVVEEASNSNIATLEPQISEEEIQEEVEDFGNTEPARARIVDIDSLDGNVVEVEGNDTPSATLLAQPEAVIDVLDVSSSESADVPADEVKEEVKDVAKIETADADAENSLLDVPTEKNLEVEENDAPSITSLAHSDAVIDVSNVSSAGPDMVKDEEPSQDPKDASVTGAEKDLGDTQDGDTTSPVAHPEPAAENDEDPSAPPGDTADAEKESEDVQETQEENMEETTGGDEEAVPETGDQTEIMDQNQPVAESRATSSESEEPASGEDQETSDAEKDHEERPKNRDAPSIGSAHIESSAQTPPSHSSPPSPLPPNFSPSSKADDEASPSASPSDSEASTLILPPPSNADLSLSDREDHFKVLLEELGWKVVMTGTEGGEEFLGLRRVKAE